MITVYSITGQALNKLKLPEQFSEEYRPDIIKRAVLAQRTHLIQPTAPKLHAGNAYSTYLSKRRREYKSTYGYGRSRTPRTVLARKGMHFQYKGAQVPQTVGGRVAHPPRLEKVRTEKINDKERKKAIRSALKATTIKEVVLARGHKVENVKELPIVIEDKVEELSKTKDVIELLEKLGLSEELERTKEKKVRAGRGKSRGRKYKKKVGLLFVVSKKCKLLDAAQNIAGVDAIVVKKLNVEMLAPGAQPGRLTIWSEAALKELDQKKLFV